MDMEELLAKISNKDVVAYMREASVCYHAGALRGCIVLSYIALFDDMRSKLEQLAKINGKAKTIWQKVKKAADDQQVFESEMADQLQAEGFLTKAEWKQLNIIREMRNRAAHPSGVEPKAEEARFVYRAVIDDFLSQRLLKTTHAVDALIEKIDKANLFPTTNLDDISAIAKAEIADLHVGAYPYLVKKLADAVAATDKQTSDNADRMLVGLCRLKQDELRTHIRSQVLVAHAPDPQYAKLIGRLIAADAKVLEALPADATLRVQGFLTASAKAPASKITSRFSHPARQLAEMVDTLGEEFVLASYANAAEAIIKEFPTASQLLDNFGGAPKLSAKLVKIWKKDAESSDFATANSFAEFLPTLDDYAEAYLSGKDALDILAGVVEAAEWNARKAKSLRSSKFASAPTIRNLATTYVTAHGKAADKVVVAHFPDLSAKEFAEAELLEA